MTRLESMRERAATTNSAARRSLVWMLLSRQRGPVRAVLALIVLHSILALMIAQEVVELVDNGIVDQAAPIGPYVSHIAKLALLSFIVGFASRQMTARIGYQLEYDLRAWLYTRVQWADLRMPAPDGHRATRHPVDDRPQDGAEHHPAFALHRDAGAGDDRIAHLPRLPQFPRWR